MDYTQMFIIMALSGVVIYFLSSNKPYGKGPAYLLGNLIGVFIGLYISICLILVVGLVLISPFLVYQYFSL